MIFGLKDGNLAKKTRMAFKRDKRHVQYIVTGFGRLIQAYFTHWKEMTEDKKRVLKYRLVTKAYRKYMKSAILRWQSQAVLKQKQIKGKFILTTEKNNLEMQANIQKNVVKII
jgi:hypothetical protein